MDNENDKSKNADNFRVVNMSEHKANRKCFDVFKGKEVFMDIVPADKDEFRIVFYVNCKHSHPLFGEIDHKQVLTGYNVERKWFHRLMGTTDEQLLDAAIPKAKKRWKFVKNNTLQFEAIREKHGISNEELSFD